MCWSLYVGLGILLILSVLQPELGPWVPLPALPCPWSPFHPSRNSRGCFPQRVQKQERRGSQQKLFLASLMLGLTSPSLFHPSPEKEAFKKRQKLQQDNGEETDENEVEEVSGHRAHTAGVSGCGTL